MTAAEHRARLEFSSLYQRREVEGAHAHMLAQVAALLYLSRGYVERWPAWGGK
jgi:hypothetical protein